jgi:hypothetical protein
MKRIRLLATPTLCLAAVATLLIGLHETHLSPHSLWAKTFLNSVHIFVFAIIAILLLNAITRLSNLNSLSTFLLALCVSIALGAMSEAAQIDGPRDASFADFVFDSLGAAGALLIFAGLRPSIVPKQSGRIAAFVSGVVVLLIALVPLLTISSAYVWRLAIKPSLISFESPFVNTFVRPQHAKLSVKFDSSNDAKVGQIELHRGAWPGLIIHDIWPDWTEYSKLVIEVSVPGTEALDIHVRVHDRLHTTGEQLYNDRFNKKWTLTAGAHELRIPLDSVRTAPLNREMDMSRIDGIVIFCTRKEAGRVFTLKRLYLN